MLKLIPTGDDRKDVNRCVITRLELGFENLDAQIIVKQEDGGPVAYLRLGARGGSQFQCAVRTRKQAIELEDAARKLRRYFDTAPESR